MESAFATISNKDYAGQWKILFFWPKDFTFVCPTEIAEFGRLEGKFADRDAQVFDASIDSEFLHLVWRRSHQDLNDLPFPMLSDIKRELSIDADEGVAQRATYIVDPGGIVRFAMVTDLNLGRNVKKVLRVLDALQTDQLCPCNWQKGENTLTSAQA